MVCRDCGNVFAGTPIALPMAREEVVREILPALKIKAKPLMKKPTKVVKKAKKAKKAKKIVKKAKKVSKSAKKKPMKKSLMRRLLRR